jgi:hypothetical protein
MIEQGAPDQRPRSSIRQLDRSRNVNDHAARFGRAIDRKRGWGLDEIEMGALFDKRRELPEFIRTKDVDAGCGPPVERRLDDRPWTDGSSIAHR